MELLYQNEKKALHRSGMWLVFTYILTTVHHVYSSTIYAPDAGISGIFAGAWRSHGFLVFLLPVIFSLAALAGYVKSRRSGWLYGYGLINALVFIGLIGLWEGGWNHLAKIVFFSLGIERFYAYGPAWLLQFPTVLAPKDLFFEATGVLTLLFGLINAGFLLKLFTGTNSHPLQLTLRKEDCHG